MSEPIAEIRFDGELEVRPYRRGTYLGGRYIEELIEDALRGRASFGHGWRGRAVVSISFYEEPSRQQLTATGN